MAPWDLHALLLRRIDLHLASANWQRGGGKGRKPKPIDLPDRHKTSGGKPAKVPDAVLRLRELGMVPVEDVKNPPRPDQPGVVTIAE